MCTVLSGHIFPLEFLEMHRVISLAEKKRQGFCPLLLFLIYAFKTICVRILRRQFFSFFPILQQLYVLFSSRSSVLPRKTTSGNVHMSSAVDMFQTRIQCMYCESDGAQALVYSSTQMFVAQQKVFFPFTGCSEQKPFVSKLTENCLRPTLTGLKVFFNPVGNIY